MDEETLRAEYKHMLALCKAAREEQLAKGDDADDEVLLDIGDEIAWYEAELAKM